MIEDLLRWWRENMIGRVIVVALGIPLIAYFDTVLGREPDAGRLLFVIIGAQVVDFVLWRMGVYPFRHS